MARSLLIFILTTTVAYADLFDFGSDGSRTSRIPALVEKLKELDMKQGPAFDEVFNQTVKGIELAIEEEKLYCAGEATDAQGKTLPPAQKQLCMRELKKQYLSSMDAIFDVKKKYLGFIHQKRMDDLGDVHKKLKADIEKNF